MNVLLDTHVLLWWLDDNPLLSAKARTIISSSKNLAFVSAASIWEISIKKSLGKLKVPDNLDTAISTSGFQTLDIAMPHAAIAGSLSRHHDDPFDRMLIAQAIAEKLTIITHDKRFKHYEIPLILT